MLPPPAIASTLKYVYEHPRLRPVLFSVAGCVVGHKVLWTLWQYWSASYKRHARKEKALERKKIVEGRCQDEGQLPSDITEQSVHELLQALKSGSVSVVHLLHAFERKAMELTNRINCITEPIVESENQAKRLDASAQKEGLLFGIPVSVKENTHIAGYDSTAGLQCRINQNAKKDAVIVQVLKKHGAIPFVRTNVPQTMLSYGCSNPLYGETVNPLDKTRGPGGSSGGEAAIIRGGGSIMGIGSDIGGSLRIPSSFCGIYTLKPTRGRISVKGVFSATRGNVAIQGTTGPVARDLDSLVLLSQALMSAEMFELDKSLPNLPFNEQEYNKTEPLRIGFYTYDGNCQCLPVVQRAVLEAKKALERMGHTVVPFDFSADPKTKFHLSEYYQRIILADRGEQVRRLLDYDKIVPDLNAVWISRLPVWLLHTAAFIVSLKDKLSGSTLKSLTGFGSLYESFVNMVKFLDWQEAFMEAWMDDGLDAVICPVFPTPACPRKIIGKITACGVYAQMYNALNYTCGVMPVTEVTKQDVSQALDPKVFAPQGFLEKLLVQSSVGSEGLPVGVQCVTLPYREEMCLRVMRDLEKGLRSL